VLRHAKEAWVNQAKDGETNTVKTEQFWNGLYTAAAAGMMMMMMMICRSHLTVNTMHLCYKGKPVDVIGGEVGGVGEIIVLYSDNHKGNINTVCHQGLLTDLGALQGLLTLHTLLASVHHTSAVVFEIKFAVSFKPLLAGQWAQLELKPQRW
jgi:hypothetical protein